MKKLFRCQVFNETEHVLMITQQTTLLILVQSPQDRYPVQITKTRCSLYSQLQSALVVIVIIS